MEIAEGFTHTQWECPNCGLEEEMEGDADELTIVCGDCGLHYKVRT